MRFKNVLCIGVASIALAGLSGAATAQVTCGDCPEDIVADNVVDTNDLLELLASWGPCDQPCPPTCAADIAGTSCEVGTEDLLALLGAWGTCQFDYVERDNAEAEQISLEMLGGGGPLLPSDEQYNRIVQDLDAIRAEVPDLQQQTHSPVWVPNQLIVKVLNAASEPELAEYDCLNEYYAVADIDFLFKSGNGAWYVLTFGGNINIPALAQEYVSLAAVEFGDPNFMIGGQNFWTPTPLGDGIWSWEIDDGWHDCFDGCDCHRVYTIETDAEGNVTVIDINEFGQSWCEFGM